MKKHLILFACVFAFVSHYSCVMKNLPAEVYYSRVDEIKFGGIEAYVIKYPALQNSTYVTETEGKKTLIINENNANLWIDAFNKKQALYKPDDMGNGTWIKRNHPNFIRKNVACFIPKTNSMILFEDKSAKNFNGSNYNEIHCFCTTIKNPRYYNKFLNNSLKNNLDKQSLRELITYFPNDVRTPSIKKRLTLLPGSYSELLTDATQFGLMDDVDVHTEASKRVNSMSTFEAFIKQFEGRSIEEAFENYINSNYSIKAEDFILIVNKYSHLNYFNTALDKQIENMSSFDEFKKICNSNKALCPELEEGAFKKVYQANTYSRCTEFLNAFPKSKYAAQVSEYSIKLKKQEEEERARKEAESWARYHSSQSSSPSASSNCIEDFKELENYAELKFKFSGKDYTPALSNLVYGIACNDGEVGWLVFLTYDSYAEEWYNFDWKKGWYFCESGWMSGNDKNGPYQTLEEAKKETCDCD